MRNEKKVFFFFSADFHCNSVGNKEVNIYNTLMLVLTLIPFSGNWDLTARKFSFMSVLELEQVDWG